MSVGRRATKQGSPISHGGEPQGKYGCAPNMRSPNFAAGSAGFRAQPRPELSARQAGLGWGGIFMLVAVDLGFSMGVLCRLVDWLMSCLS